MVTNVTVTYISINLIAPQEVILSGTAFLHCSYIVLSLHNVTLYSVSLIPSTIYRKVYSDKVQYVDLYINENLQNNHGQHMLLDKGREGNAKEVENYRPYDQ